VIDVVPAKQAILGMARSMLWVREVGPNRGAAVEAILRTVGLPPGSPWCAAFVSHIGHAILGDSWPLPLVGGCVSLAEAAEAKKLLRPNPSPGAIFLLWSDAHNRFSHTGFCVLPHGATRYGTVEGNTSPDGSPEGTGVFERVRGWSPQDRFAQWWA
jgi:hypothetical protein